MGLASALLRREHKDGHAQRLADQRQSFELWFQKRKSQ